MFFKKTPILIYTFIQKNVTNNLDFFDNRKNRCNFGII